jgi:membrane protein YdbS with pleckstrin-like domain
MNDTPIYVSRKTARSLWQQYRIYPDRLELQSWFLFHTVVVPADEIQAVEVRPSPSSHFTEHLV